MKYAFTKYKNEKIHEKFTKKLFPKKEIAFTFSSKYHLPGP
ncbi:hypothetical protein NT05LM_0571 [Listeria marthii FSL S4-120]|uniref:Uncharacterized protein n=1 Tax=Listeria marthii FSL S4-120 TaxID=702457 RepID=A0ABN0BZZ9_9LIST|nr:hypothetical protein NT05LM_0571 [Listeria marthii FSL S4-120]